MTGLLLFLWGINTAKELNFAFGGFSGKIISSGPYRIMRHPFYVSYTLIWTTGTFLFNSPVLWITLIYLVAFYWHSAKSEEKAILSSEMAREYESYCKETNMFIPRIKSWKS
jgi:protein-S-isoprenylcysteine O-methyltransferase Ste14